jgi:hypothetical protein
MKKLDAPEIRRAAWCKNMGKALGACTMLLCWSLPAGAAGAIATDDEEEGPISVYALVTGAASREDAGYAALAECRKNSGKHCKVTARFDRCGSYAASAEKRRYGVGWGDTSEIARAMALGKCGDRSCKALTVECE